jgi:membrane-associated phospholipid phosphatase
MQNAWQRGVEPTQLGTFFSGCKDIGEGRYALPIFGAAAATGLVFEGNPVGDVVGEWGSRSLRIFVVGAPPLYALQWATGASRPGESSAGSDWKFFDDNNGVSGHAFVGAVPFLAAADMVESPLLKGTLYVCSTFVAFSRMTDDAHYPSQIFLGWYLAWASARAVDATEMRFAGFEVSVMPVPIGDLGGMAVQTRW